MHAFWLDKTEHHSWPYAVNQEAEGFYRFASPPVAVDLDADGRLEVVFSSWTQIGSGAVGKLHIVDYRGEKIFETDLPPPFGSTDWNGALAAPTVGDIDGDREWEVVLNTAHSGVVAYDLPGSRVGKIRMHPEVPLLLLEGE